MARVRGPDSLSAIGRLAVKVRDRDKLRQLLEASDMSYREIAERAGVSHAVLANLARVGGRDGCSEETARRICFALDVARSDLFLS